MRTSGKFSIEARQDMDSEALDALGDDLKSKYLELRQKIEGVAESYEAKAQQLISKANAMRGWVNALGDDGSQIPPAPAPAKTIHNKLVAEENVDLVVLVQTIVKTIDRSLTFTCKEIMQQVASRVRIVNSNNVLRSIAGTLWHLKRSGSIVSTKEGKINVYSFPEKAPKPKKATLSHCVLRAIETLEMNGSKVTAKAIRSSLVSVGLFSYENLKLRDISSSVFFLRSIKNHIIVKSKTGKETTYELTNEGKAALEKLNKENACEKKARSNEA